MTIVLNLQGFPITTETSIPGCVDVSTQTLAAAMGCIVRIHVNIGQEQYPCVSRRVVKRTQVHYCGSVLSGLCDQKDPHGGDHDKIEKDDAHNE